MQAITEASARRREQWEADCLDAMRQRQRGLDVDEARQLIRAAWSIERYRAMTPKVAATRLLENPAVRPTST